MVENLLQTLGEFWSRVSGAIEAFYRDHTGLVTIILGLLAVGVTVWHSRKGTGVKKSDAPSPFRDPALRLRLLEKVQSERVDPRLRQGLREAIRVDLGLTETPGAVNAELRLYVHEESGPDQEQPIGGSILNIFEQTAGGRLLILGEPGTGKTNLLLELAESLIVEAKRDPLRPIPIVFSLPRWTLGTEPRTLAEWMRGDLAAEYGLSRDAAETLVREDRILPLLDGLDEVAKDRRAACVDAIHAYQMARSLGRLAACCRVAEYVEIPNLDLGTAIRVEKLTRTDVEREIAKPQMEYVRRAMDANPKIWEVIDTPLRLHVLFGAAKVEGDVDQGANALDRLYARYVRYALARKGDDLARRRTPNVQVLRRLGWFAVHLRLRNQTQFALEDIDLSWVPTRRARFAAVAMLVLSNGLVSVFIGTRSTGLGAAVAYFGVSLVFGFMALTADSAEDLYLDWRKGLATGCFVGLSLGIFATAMDGLGSGVFSGLGTGVIVGCLEGSRTRSLTKRTRPNEGTIRSLKHALCFLGAGLGLATFVFLATPTAVYKELSTLAKSDLASSIAITAYVLAVFKGGGFAQRHYTFRFWIWRSGAAPLRYVDFLNEAADRLFLIRHGGSYEFFHITFRDYMAETYGPKLKERTPGGRSAGPPSSRADSTARSASAPSDVS